MDGRIGYFVNQKYKYQKWIKNINTITRVLRLKQILGTRFETITRINGFQHYFTCEFYLH